MKFQYKVHTILLGRNIPLFFFLLFGLGTAFPLDKAKISQWYFEGDFEKVRDSLEATRKSGEKMEKEDSIFIYKHLSVVYAAKPDTREKAESYMYQLLKLVPTVDLIDMYISDNIESIFNTVKERYLRLEKQNGSKQAAINKSPPEQARKRKKNWLWWAAGGTGVAALVTVFILSGNEKGKTTANNYEFDL